VSVGAAMTWMAALAFAALLVIQFVQAIGG
jgi:hypothetical protein